MKTLQVLTLFAATLMGAPLDHPNYTPSLPAPDITETFNLELPTLQEQNPQWTVYFEGGLVGLFGRIPAAPIWTTPLVYHPDIEVEHTWLWVHWIREHYNDDCPPPSAVPEPLAFAIVGLGLLAIWWIPKKRGV